MNELIEAQLDLEDAKAVRDTFRAANGPPAVPPMFDGVDDFSQFVMEQTRFEGELAKVEEAMRPKTGRLEPPQRMCKVCCPMVPRSTTTTKARELRPRGKGSWF